MSRFSKPVVLLTAAALAMPTIAQTTPPAPPPAPAKSPERMTPEELRAWKKANGSFYVQCDGQPDNVSDGETAARLLGAVTLLGLFAPSPEAADPGKRKFGAEGVAVCTRLIEGDQRESSASRRLGLILGRGAHRIEAKDYAGAIADAELARKDAAEAGLSADPYWAGSRGRGADLLEAAALVRMGKIAEASAVAHRNQAALRYALIPLLATPRYYAFTPVATPEEADAGDTLNRAYPWAAAGTADRLEQLGKFAEAAAVRDALIDLDRDSTPKSIASLAIAQAAISHALAGNAARAADLANQAQAHFDRRRTEGTPDPNPSAVVEQLDLYNIIRSADAGDMKAARRLFAARSQWLSASFGATVEVNRRLRAGATPDELVGGLEKTPAQLWKARADDDLARLLAADADNKSLFAMFPSNVKASAFEAVAKSAWNTGKSPWVLKPKKPDPDANGYETLFSYGTSPLVMAQGYALHAALLAKARGHQGFVIMPLLAGGIFAARFKTGNPGDPGLPGPFFNDAQQVIAVLSPLIPDPATLKARQAARATR